MGRARSSTILTLFIACFDPITFVTVTSYFATTISSFKPSPLYYRCNRHHTLNQHQRKRCNGERLFQTSRNTETTPTSEAKNLENDASLWESVTLDLLTKLCDQCSVSYNDIVFHQNHNDSSRSDNESSSSLQEVKIQLIQRLRNHANTQAEVERQRRLARKVKVERNCNHRNDDFTTDFDESTYNPKERYEMVESMIDDNDDAEHDWDDSSDEGYFFFDMPTVSEDLRQAQMQSNNDSVKNSEPNITNRSKGAAVLTSDQVTSPPPPSIEPNTDGERVVKIYSTKQLNDLTSISASQPGQNAMISSLDSSLQRTGRSHSGSQPWDITEQQRYTSSDNNHPYIEKAKEQLIELVSTLLAMSGVPGFSNSDGYMDIDDNDDTSDKGLNEFRSHQLNRKMKHRSSGHVSGGGIGDISPVGFNPVNVPVELLATSSKAIRACRGEILDEVLRQFEIQGIGYDGTAGDNLAAGGGHYREVIKVRAFLEGYRRAEVRRLARETSSMLLNKLMIEGIDALDLTLNSMIRSNDDTEEYGGTQLNDSLLDFLNDAIRQKEQEVEARYGSKKLDERNDSIKTWTDQLTLHDDVDSDDDLDQYWNVSEVDGQRIETFDPNNEQLKSKIKAKLENMREQGPLSNQNTVNIPETAPQQVLLLLKLLRERIKAEAAFSYDEKGRNLRLLAYCIHADTDDECEQYILKQLGNSLDRLDSFIELVTSSIEYGESTSYELQPAKNKMMKLDVHQLRHILNLAAELRASQSIKASGVRPSI